jgi:serine/threonine protein kinase
MDPITSSGDASHATCPGCGLNVNLALINTSAGQPQLPVVLDYTGEEIGPYVLEECLGSGGMGTVYRARDTRSDKVVALKLLYPQLVALENVVARFQREAQALQKLVHPRIVGYIDEGQVEGRHYLVMEFVEGKSLEESLKSGVIPVYQAIDIARQIGEALEAAHAQGIVHRDLKPANVILSQDGVRVLDFGIAHMTSDDRTLTHSDALLGTVNYMSPEQRSRGQMVDHRTDLYSLGVVFYRMLTGKLPLGAFEPASKCNSQLDGRYDKLLSKVLQSNPERRHQSTAELISDLVKLRRPVYRRYLAAGGIGLVLVLVILGFFIFNPESKTQKVAEEPKEAKKEKIIEKQVEAPQKQQLDTKMNQPANQAVTTEKPLSNVISVQNKEEPQPTRQMTSTKRIVSKPKTYRKTPNKKKSKRSTSKSNTLATRTVWQDKVPVYDGPSRKSDRKTYLLKGDQVQLEKRKGKWLLVSTPDGKKGYVFGPDLGTVTSKRRVKGK